MTCRVLPPGVIKPNRKRLIPSFERIETSMGEALLTWKAATAPTP